MYVLLGRYSYFKYGQGLFFFLTKKELLHSEVKISMLCLVGANGMKRNGIDEIKGNK